MNPTRFLALLMILLLATGGAWWAGRAEPPAAPQAPPDRVGSLLPEALEQIQFVTLHDPLRELLIRLEPRTDGTWVMTEPLHDRANRPAVQNLLRTLREARISEPLPEWQGRPLADLGLEPARWVVETTFRDGLTSALRIGVEDPTGDRFAALVEGVGVRRLDRGAVEILKRPSYEWRDPQVVAQPGAVSEVRWEPEPGKTAFRCVRRGGRWRLVEPFQAPLSPSAADLLGRLLSVHAGFLQEETVTPEERRTFERSALLRLISGPEERDYRVRGALILAPDRPYVLPVVADDLRILRMDPEDLASRLVFDILPPEVHSVRLVRDGRSADYRLRSSGWYGPDGELLDAIGQRLLRSLVQRVCKLERPESRPPAPQRKPLGRLLFSRSAVPVPRNGIQLRWWLGERGKGTLAGPESADWAFRLPFELDMTVHSLLEH